MEAPRFVKNDSGFVCRNCGKTVEPLGSSSRNHCPFCLASLHVDVNPGDRAADCGGIMDAVSARPDPRHGYLIAHRCRKCGALRKNRSAYDAKVQPDDVGLLIALTAKPFPEQ